MWPSPDPHVRQFRSPLIYILVAATAVTLLLQEYLDAAVIAAVLGLNAAIGFTQERKAEGAVRRRQGKAMSRPRPGPWSLPDSG
jgi:magnesium-transporting ATPase (P-type)